LAQGSANNLTTGQRVARMPANDVRRFVVAFGGRRVVPGFCRDRVDPEGVAIRSHPRAGAGGDALELLR
jgi:hypothetical protein